MSVSVYFRKGRKKTEQVNKLCFGLLESLPDDHFRENGDILFKKGAVLGYKCYTSAPLETCNKYIRIVQEAGFLEEISLKVSELSSEEKRRTISMGVFQRVIQCEASTELPGQEIIGKFEMLRPLHHWEGANSFVDTVIWLYDQLSAIDVLSRRAFCSLYIPSQISCCANGGTTAISCLVPGVLCGISTHIESNIKMSRPITKSYRESKRFYGIYNYFLGYQRESRDYSKHIPNNSEVYPYLRYTARADCTKESALDFFKRGLI